MPQVTEVNLEPLRCYVVGGGMNYIRMLYEAGIRGATDVEDADFVMFTGGEDVDPKFYGEKPLRGTNYNTARDERERAIFEQAKKSGVPMVGICRGGQFLNVMSGGKLWQDVDNHAIGGVHDIEDHAYGLSHLKVTSTHHQMMNPAEDGLILASAARSTYRTAEGIHATVYGDNGSAGVHDDDVEVVWYDKTKCLCFQPHPEYLISTVPDEVRTMTRDYFLDLLDDYVLAAINSGSKRTRK